MRAFVYCRVSTQEQATDDHYSLANQEARCRDYIKHRSWQLVKVLKDVGSGKSDERPNYQGLLSAIRGKRVDVVVVYRLDRLSRNVVDVYGALELFNRHEVGFASVQEAFDTTTAMGRAMLGVAAVFAQLTREMISENTKDGLARRAQSGKWIGSPRSRPYGYRFADGGLHVVEAEAEVVRRMFRLFAEHGWGAAKIVKLLNAEQIPTAMGLVGGWDTRVVAFMLRNPVYVGRVRCKGKDFPGEHEPIVEARLFEAAREIVRERSVLAPRAHTTPFLLSGIAKCGRCGMNLRGHHTKYNGRKQMYFSYQHRPSRTRAECLKIHKSARRMEQLVVDQVHQFAASSRLRESAVAVARKELKGQRKPLTAERDGLLRRLAEGSDAFDKWVDRLDRGLIDEEQFARLNETHLAERRQLKERLQQLEEEAERQVDVEFLIAEVERILADFDASWEAMTVDEQRETLRYLIEYLRVYEGYMDLKLVFAPEVRLSLDFGRGVRSGVAS
jgi:site-specific DNA recombinase